MTLFRSLVFLVGAALVTLAGIAFVEPDLVRSLPGDVSPWFVGLGGAAVVLVSVFWRALRRMVLRQVAPDKVFNGPGPG